MRNTKQMIKTAYSHKLVHETRSENAAEAVDFPEIDRSRLTSAYP